MKNTTPLKVRFDSSKIALPLYYHYTERVTEYATPDSTVGHSFDKPMVKQTVIYGKSSEELWKKFYDMNRRLRYCNGEYYTIADIGSKAAYDKWYASLTDGQKFSMYYGDGIVD